MSAGKFTSAGAAPLAPPSTQPYGKRDLASLTVQNLTRRVPAKSSYGSEASFIARMLPLYPELVGSLISPTWAEHCLGLPIGWTNEDSTTTHVSTGRLRELALFAGIGGGVLGLSDHTHLVEAVEINEYNRSILRKRFQGAVISTDVCTYRARHGSADIVTGGFPCQDISSAGAGAGLYGTKSSLWFQYLRIIREVSPQFIFAENSANLVKRGLDTVAQGLVAAGYDVYWTTLSAADVGYAHVRNRCWVLGVRAPYVRTDVLVPAIAHVPRGQILTAPQVYGVLNANHRHRMYGLGNVQVPAQAKAAFEWLMAAAGQVLT